MSGCIAGGTLQNDLADLEPAQVAFLLADWATWARPDQLPPLGPQVDWRTWVVLGGRGAGKTRAGAEWVRAQALGIAPIALRPAARIALVGETYADVRRVMIEGVSGLLSVHADDERPLWEPSKRELTWPSGARAQAFSAEDPDGLRGPQFDIAWVDELAKWREPERAWDMLQFALRLGESPRAVVTTTPRPIELLQRLIADPTAVVTRAATTLNAANLAPGFLAEIERRYAGTALLRQELYGEIIADTAGSLWRRDWIEAARVATAPELRSVVVAVDPPVTATAASDACGIVVAGLGEDGRAYIYRCVRMISEAAASIPLLLYEGDVEIEKHPFLDLMRSPSYDQTTADFLESWYGHLLVAGNAYVEAVGLDGTLRELHVLRPDRMKVVPGARGWPDGFEYALDGATHRFDAEPVPGVRPILHMRLFHPLNDYYGMSPIEAAAVAIDIHNAAAKWNKALLDNAARPSGALVYAASAGKLTDDQFQRLKDELETSFQGARNAGRPMLLEGGLDWKALSMSPKDMDFIEAKNAAAREIALSLGVPPMLLGIPGDNTYSNYQEANRAFWRQTVLPLVARTTKAMSTWLSPVWTTGAPLELRPDLDQVDALASERDALWARLDKAAFLTPNEKRLAAGYPATGGGDALAGKYNPYHDDAGRFTFGPGGGMRAPDGTPVAPAAKKPTPTDPPPASQPTKTPISGLSGKEAASDVPSWARGERPYVGEDGAAFAKRLLDKKYGAGNYGVAPNSEFSKIKKYGDRGFK